MPNIVLLGTADSKLEELLYLRSQILENGVSNCKVIFVDVGRTPTEHNDITVAQDDLTTNYAPKGGHVDLSTLPRGDVIKHMIACGSNWLREAYSAGLVDSTKALHGIINAGGTGNSSLAAAIMREVLPIGFPKFIVSTNASGDVGPLVGETDITMMYSVCDISGLNYLLRRILSNAGAAIAGMAGAYERSLQSNSLAPTVSNMQTRRVGLTMFGVTTPCVDTIRKYLSTHYPIECIVFHCTGAGGRAMERLVREGVLEAVLDVTTTELCDQLCGGVMDAGPDRLTAALEKGIPCVISLGATDMVNFGPKATVPERYQHRNLFEHNPTVTLMRTSPEECKAVGEFIVEKVKTKARDARKVEVVLPRGGVSMIATPGGPFYDAEADEAIFSAIAKGLRGSDVLVVDDERDINDEGFAVDLAKRLVRLVGLT